MIVESAGMNNQGRQVPIALNQNSNYIAKTILGYVGIIFLATATWTALRGIPFGLKDKIIAMINPLCRERVDAVFVSRVVIASLSATVGVICVAVSCSSQKKKVQEESAVPQKNAATAERAEVVVPQNETITALSENSDNAETPAVVLDIEESKKAILEEIKNSKDAKSVEDIIDIIEREKNELTMAVAAEAFRLSFDIVSPQFIFGYAHQYAHFGIRGEQLFEKFKAARRGREIKFPLGTLAKIFSLPETQRREFYNGWVADSNYGPQLLTLFKDPKMPKADQLLHSSYTQKHTLSQFHNEVQKFIEQSAEAAINIEKAMDDMCKKFSSKITAQSFLQYLTVDRIHAKTLSITHQEMYVVVRLLEKDYNPYGQEIFKNTMQLHDLIPENYRDDFFALLWSHHTLLTRINENQYLRQDIDWGEGNKKFKIREYVLKNLIRVANTQKHKTTLIDKFAIEGYKKFSKFGGLRAANQLRRCSVPSLYSNAN